LKSIHPIFIVLLAVFLLLPGLAYFALRLILPADPSSPMVDFLKISPDGLVARPVSPDPQSLQEGDIVVGIQGQAVGERIRDLFPPAGPADSVEYTVRRGRQTLRVVSPLAVIPFSHLIRENWSIYLYLIYLELVSLAVFLLRPRLPAAQLFFVVSSSLFSSGLVYFLSLRVNDLLHRWLVTLYLWGAVVLYGFLLAGLVHFSLIFPKRHPLLARRPGWVRLIYLGVWLPWFVYLAARWPSIGNPASGLVLIVQGTAFMSLVYFPLLLVSTYGSYRTGNEREKRQVRWILWSLMISLIPYLVLTVLPSILGVKSELAKPFLGILWCTVPTSFAIAVLHERLFDIDVIIRRTLMFSALTFTLGLVFTSSILLLQRLFQLLTGQYQSPLATVLSTLVVAALFNPLRRRVQDDINRRFYRRRYDAEKILNRFSNQLRSEVDIDKITANLLSAVKETMEPQSLSLWIRKS